MTQKNLVNVQEGKREPLLAGVSKSVWRERHTPPAFKDPFLRVWAAIEPMIIAIVRLYQVHGIGRRTPPCEGSHSDAVVLHTVYALCTSLGCRFVPGMSRRIVSQKDSNSAIVGSIEFLRRAPASPLWLRRQYFIKSIPPWDTWPARSESTIRSIVVAIVELLGSGESDRQVLKRTWAKMATGFRSVFRTFAVTAQLNDNIRGLHNFIISWFQFQVGAFL